MGFKEVSIVNEPCEMLLIESRADLPEVRFITRHFSPYRPITRIITRDEVLAIRNDVSTKQALYLDNY